METKPRICITFAGPVGSSKSPIANYLSPKLGLAVFNNDLIRTEVLEDDGRECDPKEHLRRRDQRLTETIESGVSFICDASVDRGWEKLKATLTENNYHWFIISLDLSKEKLIELYELKGYHDTLQVIDKGYQDHQDFLAEYGDDVGLRITDKDYPDRLELSLQTVKKWLSELENGN